VSLEFGYDVGFHVVVGGFENFLDLHWSIPPAVLG
jgi:hypothetical protein